MSQRQPLVLAPSGVVQWPYNDRAPSYESKSTMPTPKCAPNYELSRERDRQTDRLPSTPSQRREKHREKKHASEITHLRMCRVAFHTSFSRLSAGRLAISGPIFGHSTPSFDPFSERRERVKKRECGSHLIRVMWEDGA
jgi:hypothetical protein